MSKKKKKTLIATTNIDNGCQKCLKMKCPYLKTPDIDRLNVQYDQYGLKHCNEPFVCLYDMHNVFPNSKCARGDR